MNIKVAVVFLAAGLVGGVSALNGQDHYQNFFTSEGLPAMDGDWTLDTGNELLNYSFDGTTLGGSGSFIGTSAVQLSGWNTADVIVSTVFTLNDARQGGTNLYTRTGFGVFGSTSTAFKDTGDTFYLVDWVAAGGTGAVKGELFILKRGGSTAGFTAGPVVNIGAIELGNTYEMVFLGSHNNGVLELSLSVFDITNGGTLLGTKTATDTIPLTGEWFGHSIRGTWADRWDADYDNFAVIPEPSSVGLIAGLVILGVLGLSRSRRRK